MTSNSTQSYSSRFVSPDSITCSSGILKPTMNDLYLIWTNLLNLQ